MISHDEIARRRLASQLVARPLEGDPAEVVRHMGAVQAQDYLGALWAVGARAAGATELAVRRALDEGHIVRTWPMRGTIHLVAPADARWMLALLAPRAAQRSQGRLRQLGLDAGDVAAAERAVVAALEGGRQLTRQALLAQLEAAGIATGGQRGYHLLWQLAHAGIICFGAHQGKQPTFALLDEWVPPTPAPSRDEALASLALRYFTSRGPATLQDFCWWSGLTVADARAGLGAVESQLSIARLDGQSYYFDEAAAAPAEGRGRVYLLPPFDEFLIAYRDRAASISPDDMGKVAPGGNGIFNPIVVRDGRVIGLWRRTLRASRVELSFSPFAAWGEGEAGAAAAEAERYGRFLGLPAQLVASHNEAAA